MTVPVDSSESHVLTGRLGIRNATGSRRLKPWRLLGYTFGTGILLTLIWVAKAPILRTAARPLVAEDEAPCGEAVWLCDGEGCFSRAAEFFEEKGGLEVLVSSSKPNRLVRLGILPPWETIARRELERRGVSSHAIRSLGTWDANAWDLARDLETWMNGHPGERVIVLRDRFRSGQQFALLKQVLAPGDLARIQLVALPNHCFDETNWWTSRMGVKEFFNAWLGLIYTCWLGEPRVRTEPWDPDQYERDLEESLKEPAG